MKSTLILSMVALACQNAGAVNLISLNYFGNEITWDQQQVFNQAANFWNTVITGYDAQYEYGPDLLQPPSETPHALSIDMTLASSSELGGTAALANSTSQLYYDDNPSDTPTHAVYYSVTGSIQFNESLIGSLQSSQQLYSLALHEMAHVLGFGSFWQNTPTIDGTDVTLYVANTGEYNGPAALAQWKIEFSGQSSATYVPVELDGDGGTPNVHWDEVDRGTGNTGITATYGGQPYDLRYELMTGWFKDGDPVFLSKTTLGAIDDLGYQVNYNMAGVIPEASVLSWSVLCAGLLLRRRR